MTLRAAGARWFELLTVRESLTAVLRCLAATGAVELQSHTDLSATHVLPELRAALDEYRQLAQRYAPYWPAAGNGVVLARERERTPEQLATGALAQLRAWSAAAGPVVDQLRQLDFERSELEPLQRLLSRRELPLPDLARFSNCGPRLASRAWALPDGAGALAVPPGVLTERTEGSGGSFLLALGPVGQIGAFDDALGALKAQRVSLPRELPATRDAALAWIRERQGGMDPTKQRLELELDRLHTAHGVPAALATMGFIDWLVREVPQLALTENFAWITGWSSDDSPARIEAALHRAGLRCLLRFTAPPAGVTRPTVLRNPRWLQPFELFSRLLGMPSAGEADPSLILAIVAPLLFGFMFGDVGQGTLLMIVGLILRRRYPAVALLIPGGAAAAAFGLAFGSLFSREDLLPPLWVRPMQEPLLLLEASLLLGAGVILTGLLLEALQALWAGAGRTWWLTRAGLLGSYLSLVAAAYSRTSLWALPAALLWWWTGSALTAPAGQRLQQLGATVGESIETLLQLGVNTLSFVRVGAFALAHAGLSVAISGMVAAIGYRPLAWVALAVGNLLMMAVEVLVVGIQTTRLILFEFFIRFLKASGRPFRPLPPPASSA